MNNFYYEVKQLNLYNKIDNYQVKYQSFQPIRNTKLSQIYILQNCNNKPKKITK